MGKTKAKAQENAKTISTGSPGSIARTNRFFIQVKGYGHCDENGKTIMGVGLSGSKLKAAPDWPLSSLIRGIMELTMPAMDYSNAEAMRKDLDKFQKWVASLHVSENKADA